MDPLRLLSRSTKPFRNQRRIPQSIPSSGQTLQPQLFASHHEQQVSRKRKREQSGHIEVNDEDVNFFGDAPKSSNPDNVNKPPSRNALRIVDKATGEEHAEDHSSNERTSVEEGKRILQEHKLKIFWLNAKQTGKKRDRKKKEPKSRPDKQVVFPQPVQTFNSLRRRFGISNRLAGNVAEQGYRIPTEVQIGALPLLLDEAGKFLDDEAVESKEGIDLLAVAPTGSGKTLAFMIPLIHQIQQLHRESAEDGRFTSSIVLAPTKELASQIVNEGLKLSKGTGVRISLVKKGMRLSSSGKDVPISVEERTRSLVKADILVSTPGVLQSILEHDELTALPHIRHLILDEADVLLDPLFREQTMSVWSRLSHPHLRTSHWSATMGSNVEEIIRSTIESRQSALHAPLIRLVVGLKDSAIPNIQHRLIYAATEQGKLMGLRQLLHPTSTTSESGPSLRPPFLVFTQTIERAVALHSELLYDIPAEAGGISRIAVLHSDLSGTVRDSVMTRFRNGEVWVLITTDLLSRGVDFRGVNGVVNYDIPTSSAAYVHRVGRTGRAGREGGVAITLYSKEDIPYLKHIANIISISQKQRPDAVLVEGEGIQQWLLDALPTLSKQEKQKLKKRGVEARTARGREKDPRAARQARISTKAGFVRKEENNRKAAIEASRRRARQGSGAAASGDRRRDEEADSDFEGFD